MNTRERSNAVHLIGTLAGGGALAGLLVVAAFQWAQPRILAHQAAALDGAIREVLGSPSRTQTLFVHDGKLTATAPAAADTSKLERMFVGYDAADRRIGFAIIGAAPGFADVIRLIYGYDPARGQVIGMKVLENKETPGLGDLIVKDTVFRAQFSGTAVPLRGVKRGAGKGGGDEVDLITGATISSRTVVNIINRSLERIGPMIAAYDAGAQR
jgi:Na+-translocating ferredoxin:NAD+ oxidoreductase subunit G